MFSVSSAPSKATDFLEVFFFFKVGSKVGASCYIIRPVAGEGRRRLCPSFKLAHLGVVVGHDCGWWSGDCGEVRGVEMGVAGAGAFSGSRRGAADLMVVMVVIVGGWWSGYDWREELSDTP